MAEGWIKIHRKFTAWEWYTDVYVKAVFIHLLLLANTNKKRWRGRVIERGQLITSYRHLAEQLKLDKDTVYRCIVKLKLSGEIKVESSKNSKFGTLVTISKYDDYQSTVPYEGTAEGTVGGTVKGTDRGTEEGTNIRNKEIKNKENIYNDNDNAREAKFETTKSEIEMLSTDRLISLLADEEFNRIQIESLAMRLRITPARVSEIVKEDFKNVMNSKGMQGNTLRDGRQHLFSWFIDYQAREARKAKYPAKVSTIHYDGERKNTLKVE